MKNVILLAALIFLILNGKAQGLQFDSKEFSKQETFEIIRGIIPEKYSLENRLPYSYPQIGGTCVAMSFTLARTSKILWEEGGRNFLFDGCRYSGLDCRVTMIFFVRPFVNLEF